MKVYITKYSLSSGIIEAEGKDIGNGYVSVKDFYSVFKIGKDCFDTMESAIKKAEDMRKKKISSLEKKIEEMKKLRFE